MSKGEAAAVDLFLQRLVAAILWYVAIGAVVSAWGWRDVIRSVRSGKGSEIEQALVADLRLRLAATGLVALTWPQSLWAVITDHTRE